MEEKLPKLRIRGKTLSVPIIQGGMGVGVSLHGLAGAVAREGCAGIISSACIDRLVSGRTKRKVGAYEAMQIEIADARKIGPGGFVGANIMVALQKDYEDSVRGAIDGGADCIISGAGLPRSLPTITKQGDTALIPIVSSGRALGIICKLWERSGNRPDAVVLEGPLAGGHLGFGIDDWEKEENRLENLLPQVKDIARKHGDFPVIVAGGIFSHDDILRFLAMGADGVQMGTRFLATEESGASPDYKQAVVEAGENDIIVAHRPGSPCGLPFRVIGKSPMYQSSLVQARKPRCDKGYVLQKDVAGNYTKCPAKTDNKDYFCICNGLLSSAGYNPTEEEPLYTVGSNASRIKKIVPVKELIDELTAGETVCSSGAAALNGATDS